MRLKFVLTMAGVGALLAAASAWAEDKPKFDFGKHEYEANCATCHGVKGKGDGPMKRELKRKPADLTVLAKKNKGVFPDEKAYAIIHGREDVASHGPRDMPIWGFEYMAKARKDYMDAPYEDEKYVKTRIDALVDYLKRLQVK